MKDVQDVIFFSINKSWHENKSREKFPKELYEATNFAWKIAKEKVKNNSIKYAFAVFHNKIIEVYEIKKWVPAKELMPKHRKVDISSKRLDECFAFDGSVADTIRDSFIGKEVDYIGQLGFTYKSYKNLIQDMNINSKQIIYPDDIENENLIEGTKKQIIVNSYERNPRARQECIDKYGYKCTVCTFDFEKIYGAIGKDFIHVHHLKPLSEVDKEYEINPIQYLRPVCPNCHAMLHKKTPAYSIEEIKNYIYQNNL